MSADPSIARYPTRLGSLVWGALLQQVVVLAMISLFGDQSFRLGASMRETCESFIIAVFIFWLAALYLILRRGRVSRRSDMVFIGIGFLPLLVVAWLFVGLIYGMAR